jgi:carboxypeptidase T
MRYFLLNLFFFLPSLVFCQNQETYSRVKIDMHGQQPFTLARYGLDLEHGNWQPNESFTGEFSASELTIIRQAGFAYETLIPDLQAYILTENRRSDAAILRGASDCNGGFYPIKTPLNYRYGSMNGYLTYQEMLSTLDSMRRLYPNLISAKTPISDSLKTIEGRPIHWLRISDNPDRDEADEPQVFYNALHHAREPNSMSQLIFYMWYLLENYATDPEVKFLVDNTALYFVPCVNPDGYVYNQTISPIGGGFWRKNRRPNADNSIGVDLNRNYGYKWGFNDNGSSSQPSSDIYRGTAAFSEPETELIRRFCNEHRFQLAMNYHTYGNLLIYPWAYNDQETPESAIFRGFSEIMKRDNNFLAGTGIQTVGYSVNGNVDDWMYGEQTSKPKIFSMTPEVGAAALYGFWPPRDAIMDLNKAGLNMNLTTAHLVHNYGVATDETPQYIPSKTGNFRFNIKRYGLKTGDLRVTLRSGSPNLTAATTIKTFTLNQMQAATDSFSFSLATTVKNGDEILFLLSVNNGTWTRTDTIRKIFGSPDIPFKQNEATVAGFQTTSNWNISTTKYYSAPSSITDSPTGNYPSLANSNITSVTPFLIPANATKAVLRFRTTWEIEPTNDYVAPSIEVNSSGTFQPICGKLTRNHPILNQPVYDGSQIRWLEEEIDLTPFVGKTVRWRFALTSSIMVQGDGFYFDDMALSISTPTGTATQFLEAKDFSISQNYPNPTTHSTTIDVGFDPQKGQATRLIVTDISGKLFSEKSLQNVDNQKLVLDTSTWPTGVYFYYLDGDNGRFRTRAKRLVVTR